MICYYAPVGVDITVVDGRPLLSTPQGGKVALDSSLLRLWEQAKGKELGEILADFKAEYAGQQTIRAGLACLAEAGLLERRGETRSESGRLVLEKVQGPKVAAVVVSYNSLEWLKLCVPSLLEQNYSSLEIVVVDNGSHDGSIQWLAENYPALIGIQIDQPSSLAHAINEGIKLANQADYFLMINPDIILAPDAVTCMVMEGEKDPACAAVAAKMRFMWAPAFINGLGNRVGPFSWGTDNALGHLDLGQFDHWRELPSACFAATLIQKSVWMEVGPIDEGFPMYYEDSEWCYRARMLGYTVLSAPQAVAYHAFGGRVPGGGQENLSERKLRNVVYGRYRFAVKLLDSSFPRFLRNYIAEDWINVTRAIARRDSASVRAIVGGWYHTLKDLSDLLRAGRHLQTRRKLSDDELFALQRDMPETIIWHGLPELTWDLVLNLYSPLIHAGRTRTMPEFENTNKRPHLLIVSNDVVDEKMAGPGMRYLEMANALRESLEITLAIPSDTHLQVEGINLVRYWEERPGSLQVLVENCDIALVSGYMVEKFPFLSSTRTRLVVDLYDPTILENLHYYLNEPIDSQLALNRHGMNISNQIVRLGDFFICGNERQRDFWLGFLAANERINPLTFAQDESLRSLIDVVGIGFPDREIQHNRKMVRGVHPQIPEDARIILWGGGIWNWLDPLTLIKAWPQVISAYPQARLIFLGTRHPNPMVPVHEMAKKAQDLAVEIGEKDRSIIFFEWISYQEREELLCEADVGVALHPIHVETRYSIRTRVLDYLWARLPVLVTDGDITSEWVREYRLGAVVPPFDVSEVADALCDILSKPKDTWRPAFEPLIERFRWPKVVEPLRRYCLEGERAPDNPRQAVDVRPSTAASSNWARAIYIWRTEGIKALVHRSWRHLQWLLARP